MKIGYSVEGSTDRALLMGLRDRWCPSAELLEGKFRGQSRESLTREIPKTCFELGIKGADVIVFLRDSNKEEWRAVRNGEAERCPEDNRHMTVFAVCERNVECWLCADATWMAHRLSIPEGDLRVADPKGAFENALGIKTGDRKEAEIREIIKDAPLKSWLAKGSFEKFYEDVREQSKRIGCQIENLRESNQK